MGLWILIIITGWSCCNKIFVRGLVIAVVVRVVVSFMNFFIFNVILEIIVYNDFEVLILELFGVGRDFLSKVGSIICSFSGLCFDSGYLRVGFFVFCFRVLFGVIGVGLVCM